MQDRPIPCYNADGTSHGFRSPECAQRLIEAGLVTPVYGRKGHLRAIFERCEDRAAAVGGRLRLGTRYSFREHLSNGYLCWRLRWLGRGDELRPMFLAVVAGCMIARPFLMRSGAVAARRTHNPQAAGSIPASATSHC